MTTRKSLAFGLPLALLAAFIIGSPARSDEKSGPQLAHMVFFSLKDHSKESRDAFVASCRKYLSEHKGTEYFSVGVIAEDVEEPVSVKDFDVALHVVFKDKEAKAKYLESERHKSFVAENGSHFAKVRVFDSYLVPSEP